MFLKKNFIFQYTALLGQSKGIVSAYYQRCSERALYPNIGQCPMYNKTYNLPNALKGHCK